ncbi:Glycoside hydrolase [Macleaya cordata]|uniref:Glycoside hydrolase n=1 Tax=Macleaya cordata TaxID=56857 RepID=A0A200Q6X0_MACCD|nr:Glycoside hydrolase [Macleaya cordata]
MVDAFNAALEKINMSDVHVAVSESGWPSAGNDPYTSKDIAKTYNTNLINHILKGGTPRRPDHYYDTFVFAMFNEDLKQPAGTEQNFGLFYPNMDPVYPLW